MICDIGQTLELQATASSTKTKEPIDVSEIECIVQAPDGTISTLEVKKEATGVYVAEYTPAESGAYRYGFDGPGVNNERGIFTVRKRQIPR
jgi:hypothetical protein